MIMSSSRWSNDTVDTWRQAKDRSLEAMLKNPGDIKRITQWFINHGWIEQFQTTKAEKYCCGKGTYHAFLEVDKAFVIGLHGWH